MRKESRNTGRVSTALERHKDLMTPNALSSEPAGVAAEWPV